MQARALVVSLLLFLPGRLLAQDTPTPFRAGQWAALFTGGASFTSLGVLKFRSPTSALWLDLRVSGGHHEDFVSDTVTGISSQVSIDLRLGRRVYRAVADKVVAQHSLGFQVGVDHFVQASPFLGTATSNGWAAGPFVELGGVYLITSHFGIGATGTASITYSRSWGESFGGTKISSWSLGGNTGIFFTATLFF
jgi:hypothetical protein